VWDTYLLANLGWSEIGQYPLEKDPTSRLHLFAYLRGSVIVSCGSLSNLPPLLVDCCFKPMNCFYESPVIPTIHIDLARILVSLAITVLVWCFLFSVAFLIVRYIPSCKFGMEWDRVIPSWEKSNEPAALVCSPSRIRYYILWKPFKSPPVFGWLLFQVNENAAMNLLWFQQFTSLWLGLFPWLSQCWFRAFFFQWLL
jgi:hypothetical protein